MLVYPSAIDLSSRTLRFQTERLKASWQEIGTRWRRLPRSVRLCSPWLTCGAVTPTPSWPPGSASGSRLPTASCTAAERARQVARTTRLRQLRARLTGALPGHARLRPADEAWEELHRTGRVARVLQHPAPEQLLRTEAEVLRLLPPQGRVDRRMLAFRAAGDPHGLDAGTDLAGLVLAEAAATGLTTPGMPPRAAWDILGVDLDRLGGGLLSLGVHPDGWLLPARFPLVLPPATLTDVTWSAPPHAGCWVFVTENLARR